MKIYIEVSGGMVQSVYTDDKEASICCVVADYDNAKDLGDQDAIETCEEFEAERNKPGALCCIW